jgi:hypothetical protein
LFAPQCWCTSSPAHACSTPHQHSVGITCYPQLHAEYQLHTHIFITTGSWCWTPQLT